MVQRRPARALRSVLVVLAAGAVLAGTAAPALAVPPPPPNPSDSQLGAARAQQDAAAAEVGRIAGLVATAEEQLEQYSVRAEAAGAAYMAAQDALQKAQDAADRADAQLADAEATVVAAQTRLGAFSHDSYIDGGNLSKSAALLDARGPGELIQRAAMLDWVAANQVDVLGQVQLARVAQANADSVARAARDARAGARAAARDAKAKADRELAAEQSAFTQLNAQKATYEQQLQAAQIQLLQLQGARNAYQQWVAQKQAEEAAARAAADRAAAKAAADAEAARNRAAGGGDGGYVLPAAGRTSSCFGARWGVMHLGMDIAAPIGTPIYAATSGVVRRAGPATGFGLAVYIEGDDGAVTVYGHVNRYFVSVGQRVTAGQQIAEVGNRGQSTGPHLHFEVHPDGEMYSGAINPGPWLRARGVDIGGC